jgi:hypothetical protein
LPGSALHLPVTAAGQGNETPAKALNSSQCHAPQGRPPLLAERWPCATGLTSYLSGCLSIAGRATLARLPIMEPSSFATPLGSASYARPFRTATLSFSWPPSGRGLPTDTVVGDWLRSNSRCPLGNCVRRAGPKPPVRHHSARTRFLIAPHRRFSFRLCRRVRPRWRKPVKYALRPLRCRIVHKGPALPVPADLCSVTRDHPGILRKSLAHSSARPVLSKNHPMINHDAAAVKQKFRVNHVVRATCE